MTKKANSLGCEKVMKDATGRAGMGWSSPYGIYCVVEYVESKSFLFALPWKVGIERLAGRLLPAFKCRPRVNEADNAPPSRLRKKALKIATGTNLLVIVPPMLSTLACPHQSYRGRSACIGEIQNLAP